MKQNLRPLPGTVVYSTGESTEVVVKITESEDHITLHLRTDYQPRKHWKTGVKEQPKPRFSTQKRQKFLCIGGPLDGTKQVPDEAPDYETYNRGSRDKRLPSAVLVYYP